MTAIAMDYYRFLTLNTSRQHAVCAQLLHTMIHSGHDRLNLLHKYQKFASHLGMDPINAFDRSIFTDRYYDHLRASGVNVHDKHIIHTQDDRDDPLRPLGKCHTCLLNIRSAHNVGAIIRSAEALGTGPVYSIGYTPSIENEVVRKTSMQTCDWIPCQMASLSECPKPWIALEIYENSTPIHEITTYQHRECSLFLGNERHGLPDDLLSECEMIFHIPLYGRKYSLNVSNAFSIAAHYLSNYV